MKNISLLLLPLLALTLGASAPQKDKKGLCKVQKVNGIEVYILCEPVTDYEVISNAKGGTKFTSLLTGGIVNESISERVAQFVKKAQQSYPKLDGVIYTAGKEVGAFKWTQKPGAGQKGMATAQKMDGHYVFVMAEPEAEYESLGQVTGGTKWKSLAPAGIVNNSIEEDMAKYLKRALSDKPALDAIVYSNGRSVMAIRWE
jgi:hypothetical protein